MDRIEQSSNALLGYRTLVSEKSFIQEGYYLLKCNVCFPQAERVYTIVVLVRGNPVYTFAVLPKSNVTFEVALRLESNQAFSIAVPYEELDQPIGMCELGWSITRLGSALESRSDQQSFGVHDVLRPRPV